MMAGTHALTAEKRLAAGDRDTISAAERAVQVANP